MNGPVVVGYDGRDQGRDALALARLLSGLGDAGMIVVSVLTYAPTELAYTEYPRVVDADRARLDAEARAALEGVDGVETVAVSSSSAPRALHDVAEERGAALIVLGSTHRGALGRIFLGSTAKRLLAAAPCSIAVAPRGFSEDQPGSVERVAVAFDGSPESQHALDVATRLPLAEGASLKLLSVLDPMDLMAAGWGGVAPMHVYPSEDREARREELQRGIRQALASVSPTFKADGEVVEGNAAQVLVEVTPDYDLLVLGSRGYGPVKRVLLGGVSAKVVDEASCPLLVVPRPERE